MPDRSGSGLQNRANGFDSHPDLYYARAEAGLEIGLKGCGGKHRGGPGDDVSHGCGENGCSSFFVRNLFDQYDNSCRVED